MADGPILESSVLEGADNMEPLLSCLFRLKLILFDSPLCKLFGLYFTHLQTEVSCLHFNECRWWWCNYGTVEERSWHDVEHWWYEVSYLCLWSISQGEEAYFLRLSEHAETVSSCSPVEHWCRPKQWEPWKFLLQHLLFYLNYLIND